MKVHSDQPQHNTTRPRDSVSRAHIVVMAVVACACVVANAQSTDLGSYDGTIKVSGTGVDPETSYRAVVKVSLPVTQRDADSISAEFLSGEAPDAIVLISQWDEAHTEKSAGADGKFASYKCSLAAPMEVPMTPSGVLYLDLEKKTHSLSLSLLGTVAVDLNCVHSTSGAFKKKGGPALYVGTGAPGMQNETQLPFSDPAHLTANYTLVTGAAAENSGAIVQEWDLRLTQ